MHVSNQNCFEYTCTLTQEVLKWDHFARNCFSICDSCVLFSVEGLLTSGNIDPSEVDDLFKLIDTDNDGKINYEG